MRNELNLMGEKKRKFLNKLLPNFQPQGQSRILTLDMEISLQQPF